jgi:hypothetical protein
MPSSTSPCSWVSAAWRPEIASAVNCSVSVVWPWMSRRGRLGDHPGAGPALRARAADVVPVRVRQDQVADRAVSGRVKVAEHGLDPVLGGSGIDRDHARRWS